MVSWLNPTVQPARNFFRILFILFKGSHVWFGLQKVVIRLQLDCDKCRTKALKIAAQAQGVSSVSLEREERDQLVVTGEVDAVCLARELRKKFQCVTLLSVEEVKKKDKDENEDKKEKEKEIVCYYTTCPPLPPCSPCPAYYPVMIHTPTVAPSCEHDTP
ncbi:6-phosphofructokinase 2 [Spatholobus suberectus]|nr:6-phosphofructokinase 2 [Spatholobus suberectus]